MSPPGIIQRGDLTQGFLHYEFGGLTLHGRVYFQNFMVHTYKHQHKHTKQNKN